MKKKPESLKTQAERGNPAAQLSYEVSRRLKNRHKKLFAAIGAPLITPSGARVPPAWKNLWITTDPKSPIQATGEDVKGRRVYLYSAEHMGTAPRPNSPD